MTPVLAFEEMRLVIELYTAMLIFLVPFSKKRPHFYLRALLGIIIFTLMTLLYFPIFHSKDNPSFRDLTGVWYFFFSVSVILYAKLCFMINWCDALYMSISSFSCQNIVYVILHQYIARVFYPDIRNHLVIYVLATIFCCCIIYFVVYQVFAKQLSKCNNSLFEDTPKSLFYYACLFLLMLIALFYFQWLFTNFASQFASGASLLGFILSVFLLTIQYSLFYGRNLYMENAKLEQFLNNNQKYYNMSKEQIEIINRKCHDLKHQLKVLSRVNDEERQSYIEEAQKSIMFYQQLVHSDNDVINTILAEKGLLCNEKEINLSCSIDSIDLNFIHVADLYAILGNAIDNAIEYVDKLEYSDLRIINLRIHKQNSFLSIQINNPYLGPNLDHGILPITTKADISNHGYGLKSIKYLVEHYNGWLEISTGDSLFTLQIMIPMVEKE